MRLAMLGFEALGIICLLRMLPLVGLPPGRASLSTSGSTSGIRLLYGICPRRPRGCDRDRATGTRLAAAGAAQGRLGGHSTGRRGPRQIISSGCCPGLPPRGRFWQPALAGLALIAGCYALYSGAGWHVFGFLPSYGEEEGLDSGTGLWLLAGLNTLMRLPPDATLIYGTGVAVVFIALVAAILRQPAPTNDAQALCRDTALLAAAAMMAISPHYYWYFAWLALPAVIAPARALLWLATVPLLLVIGPIPHDQFIWPSLVYAPATLLLLADLHPRLTIKFRRRAGLGDTACPLRLP
jgi:alpha-1,6-mannosyltransferase